MTTAVKSLQKLEIQNKKKPQKSKKLTVTANHLKKKSINDEKHHDLFLFLIFLRIASLTLIHQVPNLIKTKVYYRNIY